MKILVTGCNGFVAKTVISSIKDEVDIIGVGRSEKKDEQEFCYVQADITERESLFERVLEKENEIDVLIHAAAYLGNDEKELYITNCIGTQNVVDLAKTLNCKQFIFISSVPVIGTLIEIPVTEQHAISPRTTYHWTKYFGEILVAQLSESGICSTILRIASPVGKGMPDNKIFSVFVKNSMKNKEICIQGNGTRVQNYLDIRDFCDAIRNVIKAQCSGTYIVNGNSISDRELAEKCISVNRSSSTLMIRSCDEKIEEQWYLSGEKASACGYMPKRTIEDSIRYVAEGIE